MHKYNAFNSNPVTSKKNCISIKKNYFFLQMLGGGLISSSSKIFNCEVKV
jgi:hypothetical protein